MMKKKVDSFFLCFCLFFIVVLPSPPNHPLILHHPLTHTHITPTQHTHTHTLSFGLIYLGEIYINCQHLNNDI